MAPLKENESITDLDTEKASSAEKDTMESVDEAKIRAAVRKLDWTILPIMTMFYFLSFLVRRIQTLSVLFLIPPPNSQDRSNIGTSLLCLPQTFFETEFAICQAMRELQDFRKAFT